MAGRLQVQAAAGSGRLGLRVSEDGEVVLLREGSLPLGEPARLVGRGTKDAPGVTVDLLVQYQAARSGAYSVRLAVSLKGRVLAAPVLTLLPGRTAGLDVIADERTFHLEMTVMDRAPKPG